MHFVTVFAAEEAPQFDPDKVTPGVLGFVAIALVALAVIFLLVDMNRRIRRIRYREEVQEQLALEIAERDAAASAVAADDAALADPASDDAESDENRSGNAGR